MNKETEGLNTQRKILNREQVRTDEKPWTKNSENKNYETKTKMNRTRHEPDTIVFLALCGCLGALKTLTLWEIMHVHVLSSEK